MIKIRDEKPQLREKSKTFLGKAWHFLWKEDSIWSWLVSLFLAFILVKFVFFPILSLVFQSSMPLVVVESSSMHHPGGFVKGVVGFGPRSEYDAWWGKSKLWYENNGIAYDQAKSWWFKSGLDKGDIIVIKGSKNLRVGDIIVFDAGQRHPIIHRIVKIHLTEQGAVYETKGDNYQTNSNQLPLEREIQESQVVGKAVFRIPKFGWIKLFAVQFWNFLWPW